MYWSVDENVMTRGSQEPLLETVVQYPPIQCSQWIYRMELPWVMWISCLFWNRRRLNCYRCFLVTADTWEGILGKIVGFEKDWRQEKGATEDEMVGWHHRLHGRVWVNSGSWWWTGRPGVLQFNGVAKSWTRLSDWTELNSGVLKTFSRVEESEAHWELFTWGVWSWLA